MAATAAAMEDATQSETVHARAPRWTIYRHRLPVRVMHWINVICIFVMVGSGLSIFNAHPHLYWGKQSTFGKAAFEIVAVPGADHQYRGQIRFAGHQIDTTGVLGVSDGPDGKPHPRPFPSWATLPGPQSLALGRQWHFTFAWIFAINGSLYLLWTFASRHFSRDLAPTGRDWRGFGRSIIDHIKFKHPHGREAVPYNILQKLAYLVVILVLGPGIVLMGLAMSPHMDTVLGWLVDLVGGRQSARTIHFILAFGIIGFVLIHVFEVLISGVFNQLRSMVTGYYDVPGGKDVDDDVAKELVPGASKPMPVTKELAHIGKEPAIVGRAPVTVEIEPIPVTTEPVRVVKGATSVPAQPIPATSAPPAPATKDETPTQPVPHPTDGGPQP